MFHILVVEDDQALNKLICRVLNKNGYETSVAFDGEQALEMLDQTYIDLIVTDLMMPRMDGYDLTKALRDSGYQLPILVVTAKDTFPDKAKGFKLGIDDYMVNPLMSMNCSSVWKHSSAGQKLSMKKSWSSTTSAWIILT